jgi:hypothetical protein
VSFREPFSAINFLLHHSRAQTRSLTEGRAKSESLTRFLLCESVAQLALFLMRVAELCFGLAQEDRVGLIRKGLIYGSVSAGLTDRIFKSAYRIAAETLRHYTGEDLRLDESLFRMPEPPHVSEVQAMVGLLLEQPVLATTLATITDVLIFECYLKGRSRPPLEQMFRYSNLDGRVDIVRVYLELLKKAGAVPAEMVSAVDGVLLQPHRGNSGVPTASAQDTADREHGAGLPLFDPATQKVTET